MRGHQYRDARFRERVDAPPELAPRQRIHAGRRFVEEQDLGLVHQRAGECEPLLEAERKIARRGVEHRGETELRHGPVDAGLLAVAPEPIRAAEEPQVLLHRQVGVERKLLCHVSDAPARRCGRGAQVETGDVQSARRGRKQAAQHPEGGGFSRAIGAEQAENLAPGNRERHVMHGDEAAEAAREVLHGDHGFGRCRGGDCRDRRVARRRRCADG